MHLKCSLRGIGNVGLRKFQLTTIPLLKRNRRHMRLIWKATGVLQSPFDARTAQWSIYSMRCRRPTHLAEGGGGAGSKSLGRIYGRQGTRWTVRCITAMATFECFKYVTKDWSLCRQLESQVPDGC